MSHPPFASALERRFSARPHVGVVTHFEGLDVPAVIARVHEVMRDAGLHPEGAVEQLGDRSVFNAVAAVPAGDGMELWLIANEQPGVGSKIEVRLFHAIEDSAQADEYLATFAGRLGRVRDA